MFCWYCTKKKSSTRFFFSLVFFNLIFILRNCVFFFVFLSQIHTTANTETWWFTNSGCTNNKCRDRKINWIWIKRKIWHRNKTNGCIKCINEWKLWKMDNIEEQEQILQDVNTANEKSTIEEIIHSLNQACEKFQQCDRHLDFMCNMKI